MKKKIKVFAAIALFSVSLTASFVFTQKAEATICHHDKDMVCRIVGYGPWACYCMPEQV